MTKVSSWAQESPKPGPGLSPKPGPALPSADLEPTSIVPAVAQTAVHRPITDDTPDPSEPAADTTEVTAIPLAQTAEHQIDLRDQPQAASQRIGR